MMKQKCFKVFVDFDGTITLEDVGEAIFQKFGNTEKVNKIIEELLSDKISSKKCWDRLCDSIENLDKKQLDDFIDMLDVDPSFKSFVEFCKENEIELVVLSDGFDYYIERIFKRENLSELIYYSNKLFFNEKQELSAEYPYYDSDFPTSANCKRNHIINHSSDEDFTIYIGDGNSDKEAAPYCDFIFAKDGLLKFCEKERISFFPFDDFEDVTSRMRELMSKRNLKKRHQAVLKRKAAYTVE